MKKSSAKKRSEKRNKCIEQIISKVNEMCNYAIENLCTQPAQFEELEMMLNEYVR